MQELNRKDDGGPSDLEDFGATRCMRVRPMRGTEAILYECKIVKCVASNFHGCRVGRYFHRDNSGKVTPKGEREVQRLRYASSRPALIMRYTQMLLTRVSLSLIHTQRPNPLHTRRWISAIVVARYQQGGIAALPPVFARMFQQMSEAMTFFQEASRFSRHGYTIRSHLS